MDRVTTAADQVATLLLQLEKEIDQAFATAGCLASALPDARSEARLPAVASHHAYGHFCAAIAAIGAAHGHTVALHRSLDVLAKRLGYEKSYGDTQPNDPFTTAEITPLRTAA